MKTTSFSVFIFFIFALAILSCKKDCPSEPQFNISGSGQKAPVSVKFKVVSNQDNITYIKWDFGDGNILNDETEPTHTYTQAGEYNVTLTIGSDIEGCKNQLITQKVTVLSDIPLTAPTASFNADIPSNCVPPCSIQFTNTSTNATSYLWNFGISNSTSTENSPSFIYNAAGTYSVTLTASGPGGTASSTKTITVGQNVVTPIADFTFSNNNCQGPCTVNFNNISSNATQYTWLFGDGSSSSQTNPSHYYTTAGTYNVVLTAYNNSGQSSSQSKSITINSSGSATAYADLEYVSLDYAEGTCTYYGYPDFYYALFEYDGSSWQLVTTSYVNYEKSPPTEWYCFSNCPTLSSQKLYILYFYLYDTGIGCYTGSSQQIDLSQHTSSKPYEIQVPYGTTKVTIGLDWF